MVQPDYLTDSFQGSSFSSLQPGGVGSGKQDDLRFLQNSVRAPQGNKSMHAVTTLRPDVSLKQARSSQQHQQAPKHFLQSQQIGQKILPQDMQQLERQQRQAEATVPSVSKRNATGRPLDRLIQAMKSLTPQALSSAVGDVESLVSMIDCLAGSAYNNDPMADIPEDLAATARCYLREGNFVSQDGSASINKIKSLPCIIPLKNRSSVGIVLDSFKQQQDSESFKLETTTNCCTMKQKTEVKHALREEIRKINQMLIDTVVEICDETGEEGIVVECSFTPVALSPSLKARITSAQLAPIKPLKLLVPANFPKSSPLLLDKYHADESIPGFEDLFMKAKSKFCIDCNYLSQSMSLAEMAKTWDACVRNTVLEYAQQNGGGSFSTRYGSWENCVDF